MRIIAAIALGTLVLLLSLIDIVTALGGFLPVVGDVFSTLSETILEVIQLLIVALWMVIEVTFE